MIAVSHVPPLCICGQEIMHACTWCCTTDTEQKSQTFQCNYTGSNSFMFWKYFLLEQGWAINFPKGPHEKLTVVEGQTSTTASVLPILIY